MGTKISHSGTIESIADGCVKVRILQASACAACKVAGHCNAAESKEKIVDVFGVRDTSALKVGDTVVVSTSQANANRALVLGFGGPFLVLVVVLVVVLQLTSDEGLSAVIALLALLPYYLVLYLFRNHISNKIAFYIE